MFNKHFRFASTFLLLALISRANTAGAQEINSKTKPIEKVLIAVPLPPNSPIRIEEVKIGDIITSFRNQTVKSEQSDWLRDLSFKVRNLTRKKIIYISLNVMFPDIGTNGQLLMSMEPRYGQTSGFSKGGREDNTAFGGA